MKQDLLKLLQQKLRGEPSHPPRPRSRSPWLIGGFALSILAVSYFLHETKAPLSAMAKGADLVCTVKAVFDGDTLAASCEDGEVKVRVFGIDAPEMKQEPWGDRSLQAMRGLLPRRDPVRLQVMDHDRYGRTVALVFAGERDAGLEMVRQGRAVVYKQYNDLPAYRQAQAEAQRARRGIWEKPGGQQDPTAWRRLNPR